MLRIHHNLDPRKVWVANSFLTAGEVKEGNTEGKMIAVSFYPGSVPTFTVLLRNGSIFNYVPPHKCWARDMQDTIAQDSFSISDLCYHDCPDEELVVHRFDFKKVYAYIKRQDVWFDAEYICSVDWYTGNDLLHLLQLSSGHFAWLPNHKINSVCCALDGSYRKVRETFSVGSN